MTTIRYALFFLSKEEKWRGLGLVFFIFIGALLEALGIGLFLPFIGLVSDPTLIDRQKYMHMAYAWMGSPGYSKFLLLCCAALVTVIVFKNLYIGAVTYAQNAFLAKRFVVLTQKMLQSYLGASYLFHLQRNPVELARQLEVGICSIVLSVYTSLLILITESLVLGVIATMMLFIRPGTVIGAVVILGGSSFAFYRFVRMRLRTLGDLRNLGAVQWLKWLNQSFAGIKELIVLRKESFFLSKVTHFSRMFGEANFSGAAYNLYPRFFIEMIGITSMTLFVAAIILDGGDPKRLIPVLALFALAAIRLMPSMTRVVSAAIMIRQSHREVAVLYEDYKMVKGPSLDNGAVKAEEEFRFEHDIEFRGVNYQYQGNIRPSVHGFSLQVKRGESVAFVGYSGAGKTTAVDILLGLLPPQSGGVFVDGRDIQENIRGWCGLIGYIPQTIYLSDDTIRRNVAFGLADAEIDDGSVWEALNSAQLADFVRGLPSGLDTLTGDRGLRLSGGQRQRIGIARALYSKPDVLVLDEATSALDNETEKTIIESIDRLRGSKTIFVIAHRLTTVSKCDRLYFMKDGAIQAEGTYQELCAANESFRKFAALGNEGSSPGRPV